MLVRLLLLWLVVFAVHPAPAMALAVTGVVRVSQLSSGVSVRLALSAPLAGAPSSFALAYPWRIAVDLPGASSLKRSAAGVGGLRQARVAQFDADTARIVLDLGQPMQIVAARQEADHTLELRLAPVAEAAFRQQVAAGRRPLAGFASAAAAAPPATAGPPRLDAVEQALADIAAGRTAPAPPPPAPPSAPSPPSPPAAPAPAAAPAPVVRAPVARPRSGGSRYVVVLDAGHGGTDPGAPSVRGDVEKVATLAIVHAAKAAIERAARARGLGVVVHLTRADDQFVRLASRVRKARDWNADLFISVHADSAANSDARGASVYTLSETASDRMAARLAAKENRADLIAGVDLTGENREVAGILVDIGMRDSMNASSDFAEVLQASLQPKGVRFRSQFHHFANFQVLRNLGVPAVLLESGYLSNADDAAYLFSKSGQRAIADGIADAVVRYLGS